MKNHLQNVSTLLVFFIWNIGIGTTEASPPVPTHSVQFAAVPEGVYTCWGKKLPNAQFKVQLHNYVSSSEAGKSIKNLECETTTTTSGQTMRCPGIIPHKDQGPNEHFYHTFWIGVTSYTPYRTGGTGHWARPHVGNWGSGIIMGTPTRVSFDKNCKIHVETTQ